MINYIKQAVESVEGIKSFLFNTDYRNNFDLQNVEFPCCVLTPIMRTNYDLNNIIRESAELQLSVVDLAPYEYSGDDLYEINKRCSDIALQVIANLQVKSKLDKELTFEFILPSGDELISGVMCNLTATMRQGSCIGKPSYVEVIVQPVKRESITSNGKHVISADSGFNAMREVEVDVQVPQPNIEPTKQVTFNDNTTTTITPSEGYDAIESVEVTTDINTLQGLDFSEIYDDDFSNEINQDFKDGIKYAKEIYATYNNSSESSIKSMENDSDLIFLPNIKMEKLSSLANKFRNCKLLQRCGILDFQNCSNFTLSFFDCSSLKSIELLNTNSLTLLYQTFQGCSSLQKLKLTSLEKMKTFVNGFTNLYNLEKLEFDRWKQTNINAVQSSKLSSESIDYNIENAIDKVDGATNRTFTLHATAGANWDANSKYQGEERNLILTQKGIEVTW